MPTTPRRYVLNFRATAATCARFRLIANAAHMTQAALFEDLVNRALVEPLGVVVPPRINSQWSDSPLGKTGR